MARPSYKSPGIEIMLGRITGTDRYRAIELDYCVWCESEITEFRDELSAREYTISGLCQGCQDDAFGEE